jgi:hypothetical protein
VRIIKRMRRQTAVYWGPGGEGEQGQRIYADPVEIKCRWEQVEEEYLDMGGNRQLSRARVYVGTAVERLGVLWLPPNSVKLEDGAALAQLTDAVHPFSNDGAFEIRLVETLPVLRVRKNKPDDFLRTAYL